MTNPIGKTEASRSQLWLVVFLSVVLGILVILQEEMPVLTEMSPETRQSMEKMDFSDLEPFNRLAEQVDHPSLQPMPDSNPTLSH